eukprot:2561620-Rhodomonas_salina.1
MANDGTILRLDVDVNHSWRVPLREADPLLHGRLHRICIRHRMESQYFLDVGRLPEMQRPLRPVSDHLTAQVLRHIPLVGALKTREHQSLELRK